MQYTDLVTALPDNLLVKVDRMLMGWGVEGRVPFLDHRIVEFGLSLPDELKIEGRQGKAFLKRWAADFTGFKPAAIKNAESREQSNRQKYLLKKGGRHGKKSE